MKFKSIPNNNLVVANEIVNTLDKFKLFPKRITWLNANSFSIEYDSIGKFFDVRKIMYGSIIPDSVSKTKINVKSKRIIYEF